MKREKWKQTCKNLNPRNPNTKLWHLAKHIDRAQPQTENTNLIKNIDGTPATNDKNAANLLAKKATRSALDGYKRSNISILNEINPVIESQICKQRLTYYGHIVRTNCFQRYWEKLKKKKGRLIMIWLEGVKKTTGRSLDELRVIIDQIGEHLSI
ncbi:hypothetical protein LAZ67_18001169 [Cordylochernes scorpioides]|uniref:Uncharacterized protein n=1 Tax=Cordylochernes scorpioides TaxID=51811 RepID=A0ABY6LFJ4_9ARAC|nr:hypothetical protein LAZ67_18001169 [Cordylochernes scorpioides]